MRYLFLSGVLFLTLMSFISGCFNSGSRTTKTKFDYNLTKPDKILVLHDTLREVSGLTETGTNSFACIQDENGIIFICDALNGTILKQSFFHVDGDYEGIARVGNTLYILRSDGVLFEVSEYQSEDFKLSSFNTGIPANNNEGLCYDKNNNRLLIACKGKLGKGPEFKNLRVIYGFDMITKKLSTEPVFEFDLQVLRQFAINNKIDLPTRSKKRGQIEEPIIRFRASAINIHPVTNKLYLLSAMEHMLFIFDMEGSVEQIVLLDPKIFIKPEGITFFENGDLLISNEGQDKNPTVLRYNILQ